MYKRLICLAIVGAMAIPAAAAAEEPRVNLYGVGRVSLDYVDNNNGTSGQESGALSLSSNQSNLGIYATEGIGNGLAVVGRLEGGVRVDTGTVFNSQLRDTFVGMDTPYGLFRAGHYSSAYKLATESLDPFRDTIADAQAVLGNVDGTVLFSEWYNNVVGWRSAPVGRIRLSLDYIVNQGNDNLPQTTAQSKQNGVSLDVHWRSERVRTGIAYEGRNNYAGQQDISAFEIYAGAYVMDRRAHVAGVFENAARVNAAGTGTNDRNALYMSATYRLTDVNALQGAFGWLDGLSGSGNADTGAVWFAFGASHNLSKTTRVYALFTLVSNDKNSVYGLGQFQEVPGAAGENAMAFSVGLEKSFGDDGRPAM